MIYSALERFQGALNGKPRDRGVIFKGTPGTPHQVLIDQMRDVKRDRTEAGLRSKGIRLAASNANIWVSRE